MSRTTRLVEASMSGGNLPSLRAAHRCMALMLVLLTVVAALAFAALLAVKLFFAWPASFFQPAAAQVDPHLYMPVDVSPAPTGCISIDAAHASIMAQVKNATVREVDAARYMPIFNTLPPISHFAPPQKLFAYQAPDRTAVLLLGFSGNCQVFRGLINKPEHNAILSKIDVKA